MKQIELPPRGLETLFGVHDQNIKYLESLLERVGGNVSRAAEQAGKHRSDFYELLNRYRIDPSRFRKGTHQESSPTAASA